MMQLLPCTSLVRLHAEVNRTCTDGLQTWVPPLVKEFMRVAMICQNIRKIWDCTDLIKRYYGTHKTREDGAYFLHEQLETNKHYPPLNGLKSVDQKLSHWCSLS